MTERFGVNKMKKGLLVLSLFSLSGLLALVGNNQKANKNIFEESTTLENQNAKKLNVRSNSSGDVLVSNVLKAQVSETSSINGENVKSLRVVAGISDLNITPYFDRAEINVDGNVIMPQKNTHVSYAYKNIINNGVSQTAAEVFESTDYKYFVTYTLKDIPEQYWFTPISITLKVEGSDTSVSKTLNVAALAEEYQNSSDYSFYKIDDNNVAIGLANMELEEANIPEYYLDVEDTDTTLLGKRIRITNVGYHNVYPYPTENNILFTSSSLKSVKMPEGITTIASYCFYGASSLASISLPQSVTSIDNYAFLSTNALEQIILPKNVIVGMSVFGDHHENLKIYFEGKTDPTSNWNPDWSHGLSNVNNRFFLYSETEPTGTSPYGCWHYDANNQPVLW